MSKHASGTFEVKMGPQPAEEHVGDPTVARLSIDKQFHGDLEAASKGQMLAVGTDVKGSPGDVAIDYFERAALHVVDGLSNHGRNGMRLVGAVVEDDDRRGSQGGDGRLALADDRMFQAQTGATDPRDANADVDRIGKGELATVVAGDRRQDRPDPLGLEQVDQTDALTVGDPGRLEPAEVGVVVDMAERILIAPEDRQRDHDGIFLQQAARGQARWSSGCVPEVGAFEERSPVDHTC